MAMDVWCKIFVFHPKVIPILLMNLSKTDQFWLNIIFNIFLISFYVTGGVGYDGQDCGVTCPIKCGVDDITCYGGEDENGCPIPDTCMPTKGGEW
jgi:hypothetical protein